MTLQLSAPELTLQALLVGVGANALLALVSLRVGAVTRSGAVAGFAVAAVVFLFGGAAAWAALGVFFVVASAAGRIGSRRKSAIEARYSKGSRRDGAQVLANGGVAAAMVLIGYFAGSAVFVAAAVASVAEAAADTIASEIGVLSRRPPRSILGLRPLETGESGGVTALGTAAAAGGALVVTAVWTLLQTVDGVRHRVMLTAALVWVAGFMGSLLDSVLGAAVQATYRSTASGRTTERSTEGGAANTLLHGKRWVTNDVVNAAGTLAAAVAVLLVLWMARPAPR